MEPAIRIQGLSKSFMIGHQTHRRYVTLRDEFSEAMNVLRQFLVLVVHNMFKWLT